MLVSSFSIGLAFGLAPNRFCAQFSESEELAPHTRTRPQRDCRGLSSVGDSPNADPESYQWLRRVVKRAKRPTLNRTVAEAPLMDSLPDNILRGRHWL